MKNKKNTFKKFWQKLDKPLKLLPLYLVTATQFLVSCGDFQKIITVPLPNHESRLIAECYLDTGKNYRMLVSESVSYFEGARLPDVPKATVWIKYKGKTDTLRYKPVVLDSLQKVYNYQSSQSVVYDTLNSYELYVRDDKGRTLKAKTKFLPVVKLDSISWHFSTREGDKKAYLLIRFKDNPKQENYYRLMVHKSTLEKRAVTDFFLSDRFFAGSGGIITGYNYEEKDTLFVTLYHIEKSFFQFLDTSRDAARANGNPFALPSGILSNIEGDGTGIFTTLAYDRKKLILKR